MSKRNLEKEFVLELDTAHYLHATYEDDEDDIECLEYPDSRYYNSKDKPVFIFYE